jgi:hypothetical protein
MRSKLDSLRRLFRCVRVLGLWLGYRYWRLDQYARKDPGVVLNWCDAMERMVNLLLEDGKKQEAELLLSWSTRCREAHAQYIKETSKR